MQFLMVALPTLRYNHVIEVFLNISSSTAADLISEHYNLEFRVYYKN